ncbi:MAG: serine/threonine protein kinase, partial [Labilithrix sp.]|nr:serine/threonine protein kinase [Labilithrix sp.]
MNGKRPAGPPLRVEESGVIEALGPRDLSLAASVGKYRFLGVLGHGGMADVYLAMADGPEGFRKLCVVKMLKEEMSSDDDFRAMFVDEARLAARLTHPNIVQTYEVESVNGHLLLAMEYVEGATMARVRRRMVDGTFPLEASVRVLCDVLDALSYAHGALDFDGRCLDIVHRDVSPHNIIVGYSGNVKLLDFGIAKSTAAIQATQAGVLKGKVGYMAPEQASFGHVDRRADIFSVGVILWEAIAGRRLAEGSSSHASLLKRIEGSEPRIEEVVPDVDPQLADIVGRALATHPEDRYATADELQTDLEGWLSRRTEMPRRTWAASIAAAFADDRRKFQALANERTSDPLVAVRSAPGPRVGVPVDAVHEPGVHSSTPTPVHSAPHAPPTRSRPMTIAAIALAAVVVGLLGYVAATASSRSVAVAAASARQTPSGEPAASGAPSAAIATASVTDLRTAPPEPSGAAGAGPNASPSAHLTRHNPPV